MSNRGKKKKVDIYEKYRCILNAPDLTNKEIDEMKKTSPLAFPDRAVSMSGKRSTTNLWKKQIQKSKSEI